MTKRSSKPPAALPRTDAPAPAVVTEVPRNDLAAVTAFYESRGQVTPEELHILYMLQDDDAELRRLVKSKKWNVVDPFPWVL